MFAVQIFGVQRIRSGLVDPGNTPAPRYDFVEERTP